MLKLAVAVIIEGLMYAIAFNAYQMLMYGMSRHTTDNFIGLLITCMLISSLGKLVGVAMDKKFKL